MLSVAPNPKEDMRLPILAIAMAFALGSMGAASPAARLTINGRHFQTPDGKRFQFRGFNAPVVGMLPGDAASIKAMGGNSERIGILWGANHDCAAPAFPSQHPAYDAYDPTAPGNIAPARLAILDANIASAGASGLWIDLLVSSKCVFDSPGLKAAYPTTLAFLAARYKNTPFIGVVEPLVEPKPINGNIDNAGVQAFYTAAIATYRAVDPATPLMVGGAKYNVRFLSAVWNPAWDRLGVAATYDFYEPKCIAQQQHKGPPPFPISYPGVCRDIGGNAPGAATYPNAGSKTYQWNKAGIANLLTVITAFQVRHPVPAVANQVGVPSITGGALALMGDALDELNAIGSGWEIWSWREGFKGGSIPPGGGDGLWWQDAAGAWHVKADWQALYSSRFKAPLRARRQG